MGRVREENVRLKQLKRLELAISPSRDVVPPDVDEPERLRAQLREIDAALEELGRADGPPRIGCWVDESPVRRADPRSAEELAAARASFRAWALRELGPDSGLGDRFEFEWDGEHGAGLVAARDLAEDEQFVRVPRRAVLGASDALGSPDVQALLCPPGVAGGAVRNPNQSLALALYCALAARGEVPSRWGPYLGVLPRAFGLPMLWSQDSPQAELLRGSTAALRAAKLRRDAAMNFCLIRRAAASRDSPVGRLPWLDFLWGLSVVMTRQNQFPVGDEIVLVPVWDMCNHAPGRMATSYDPDSGSLLAATMERVPAGAPIRMDYGPRPNTQLFVYSGFVATDGPAAQRFAVTLGLPRNQAADEGLRKIQGLLLSKNRQHLHGVEVTLPLHSPLSPDIMRPLRVAALCDRAEAAAALRGPDAASWGRRNDRAATELLATMLRDALSAYGPGDVQVPNPQAYAVRLARQVREYETRFLREAVESLQRLLEQLPQPEESQQ